MEAKRIAATGQALIYGATGLFLLCLMIGGGSSRDDVPGLLLVRLSALVLMAVLLLRSRPADLRLAGLPLLFVGLLVGLMVLQLVPLPPAIWLNLPGRAFYADAAAIANMEQPWRPLSLAPDLTIEAILALLPVIATILFLGLGAGPSVGRAAAVALIWIVVVSAVLAALQQSGGPESPLRLYRYTNLDAGVGLLANRNHQALLMAMGIPAATWWAMRQGRVFDSPPVRLAVGASLIFLSLIGTVLTESRTGLILCGVSLMASVALAWPMMRRWPTIVRVSGFLTFALGAAFAIFMLLPTHRLSMALFFSDPRSRFWPRSIDMVQEYFPVGAGFGTFERVYPRFERMENLVPAYLNRAHNDFIEIGAEAGLIGYFLATAFIGWWVITTLRVWRTKPGAVHDVLLGRLGSILIGLGLIASITDYPLRTPLLASIFVGACTTLARTSRAIRHSSRLR